VSENSFYRTKRAEERLALLEANSSTHPKTLALAQWLVALSVSQSINWPSDCASTRKAVALLKKALKGLRYCEDSPAIAKASARGLLAEAYFAKGDYVKSVAQYEKAINILPRMFKSDEFSFFRRLSEGLQMAERQLD
jgi:tetratricopeptide (TPR) repeat protein